MKKCWRCDGKETWKNMTNFYLKKRTWQTSKFNIRKSGRLSYMYEEKYRENWRQENIDMNKWFNSFGIVHYSLHISPTPKFLFRTTRKKQKKNLHYPAILLFYSQANFLLCKEKNPMTTSSDYYLPRLCPKKWLTTQNIYLTTRMEPPFSHIALKLRWCTAMLRALHPTWSAAMDITFIIHWSSMHYSTFIISHNIAQPLSSFQEAHWSLLRPGHREEKLLYSTYYSTVGKAYKSSMH